MSHYQHFCQKPTGPKWPSKTDLFSSVELMRQLIPVLLFPLSFGCSMVNANTGANPLGEIFNADNLARAVIKGADLQPGQDGASVTIHFPATDELHTIVLPMPPEAADWSAVGTFTLEVESTSTVAFSIRLVTANKEKFSYAIHPFVDVPVRVAISGETMRHKYTNHSQFKGYWLSNWKNHIDLSEVVALEIDSKPNVDMTVHLRNPALHDGIVKDAILADGPFVDQFGQWISLDWPGKISSVKQLKRAWAQEDAQLWDSPEFGFSRYGGWKEARLPATGFFRTTEVDGRWWLVDPDGYLFYSVGMDCVRHESKTRVAGREKLFSNLPRDTLKRTDFYRRNARLRYGEKDYVENWKEKQNERLRSWGFNTVANWSDAAMWKCPAIPFVIALKMNQSGKNWHRFPDVFSQAFEQRIAAEAEAQCAPYKDEPMLIGYFTGNEERWPHRNFIDQIINDPEPTATQAYVNDFLKEHGDTENSREQLVEGLARTYFKKVTEAIRKADPNHLVLGIRWAGGRAPDAVVRANDVFDVFSINFYSFRPDEERVRHVHNLTGLPVIIGEFHFGTVDRGFAPALVSVKNQRERGVAYKYYAEHAAALPMLVGAHYFQYLEQPVTGRFDGENFGFGFLDQQDIPFPDMIRFARDTHRRIYPIHFGTVEATNQEALVR